jgi:NAD+ diphosphatase
MTGSGDPGAGSPGGPGNAGGPGTGGLGDRPLALARSGVDRAAARRTDEDWLAAAWADEGTRVLLVSEGRVLATGEARPELVLTPPGDAPAGGERYLLGVDAAGIAYFALAVPRLPEADARPPGARRTGIREIGALLPDLDAGLLVHAVALEQWHRAHGHCARCGAATRVEGAGHLRRCPVCDTEHYPRTDPAVIVLITDPDDRLLLGRQERWPPGRYSIFAGFVEPGESLEQAVVREIAEEVGLIVTDVRYVSSQPWPFPSSLMLGFTAKAKDPAFEVDGTEITHARWYSRAELRAAVDREELLLPSGVSIARRLVDAWYGEPLPEENHW